MEDGRLDPCQGKPSLGLMKKKKVSPYIISIDIGMAALIEYFLRLINPKAVYESINENEEIEYLRMITDLPPEEILRLRERFDILIDENHDDKKHKQHNGMMTKECFMNIENIARNPLKERIAVLCGFENDNSEITKEEFVVAIGQFNSPGKREEKTKLAFRLHDGNNDGFIDQNDLKEYLTILTEGYDGITLEQIEEAVVNAFNEFEVSTRTKGITIADFQLAKGTDDFYSRLQLRV